MEESVKRFERSNGLDTALYKTIPFLYVIVSGGLPSIIALFSVNEIITLQIYKRCMSQLSGILDFLCLRLQCRK